MIKKEIFREYDIRGIYDSELNEDTAYLIGKSYGTILQREYNKKKCIVGYDNRLSSVSLYEALVKGILETGVDVVSIGLTTTPMYYFAWDYLNVKCGVMITASHNPKEYNGFKFSYNGLHNAFGASVYHLFDIIQSNDFIKGNGILIEKKVKDEYINLLLKGIKLGDRQLKVVFDCGNGTTSIVARDVLSKLDIELVNLYDVSNGEFPNHHPDPCVEDNLVELKRTVVSTKADIGVAYDGDGDRVGVVDEKGNYIPTDLFMVIIWRDIYNKIKDKRGLLDVKCSKALEDEMIKLGIKPIIYRTGNSYTKEKMVSAKLPFGGELSGHVYFQDKFPGYDDGIYASLRIIEILSYTDKTLSSLLDGINKYYNTPEIKIEVSDNVKFKIIDKVKQYAIFNKLNFIDIDGVKILYEDGFALIRASNTGPNITLRFEARDKDKLKEIKEYYVNLVNKYIKEED